MRNIETIVLTSTFLLAASITKGFPQAGMLDPTFDPGTGANDAIYSIALQPDGKIVAVGLFTNFNSIACNRIVRLNTDGSVDTGFACGTGADDVVLSIAVRNNKIVIGGFFRTFNGHDAPNVARLNLDGSLDSTFYGGAFNEALGIASDDKVLLGGSGYRGINEAMRLLASGAVDLSFRVNIDHEGAVHALAIQQDDKTVIAGSFMNVNDQARFRIARINVEGTLDNTFIPAGGSRYEVDAIGVCVDGGICQAGYLISRLNSDGSLDSSFHWSDFDDSLGWASAIAMQMDGKPIIAGHFTSVTDFETETTTYRNHVARLNSDGSLDETFGANQSLADDVVEAVTIQSNGRIIIGGSFITVNGVVRPRIARLLGDRPVLDTRRGTNGEMVLKWPAVYTNYVLQTASNVTSTNWLAVTDSPAVISNMFVVTNLAGSAHQFFRLAKP